MAEHYLDRFTQTRISQLWLIIIRHIIFHEHAEIMCHSFIYVLKNYFSILAKDWEVKMKKK